MFADFSFSAESLNKNHNTSSLVLFFFIFQSTVPKLVHLFYAFNCYLSPITISSTPSTKNIHFPCVPILTLCLPFSTYFHLLFQAHQMSLQWFYLLLCLISSCSLCLCPPSHLSSFYSSLKAYSKCHQFCEATPNLTYTFIYHLLIITTGYHIVWFILSLVVNFAYFLH